MKTHPNKTIPKLLIVCFIIYFTTNSFAQNYSISETIQYINNTADSEYVFDFKNDEFIVKKYGWVDYRVKKTRQWEISNSIHLSDISRVSVGEPNSYSRNGSHSTVSIYCKYGDECAKAYYAYPKYTMMPVFIWDVGNSSNAEKIANAIRYIIEKAPKTVVNNDPFSKYSKKSKDYRKINISELYVGMSKRNVFNTLNTKPVVESIETGYEVYRVKRNNDQYFLYFTNNKLTRVDKGESVYDTIIIID